MAELLPQALESLSLEDPPISVFERRNDIHIYLSDELVIGTWNYEYCHFYFSPLAPQALESLSLEDPPISVFERRNDTFTSLMSLYLVRGITNILLLTTIRVSLQC